MKKSIILLMLLLNSCSFVYKQKNFKPVIEESIKLGHRLMEMGQFQTAEEILYKFLLNNPENILALKYYQNAINYQKSNKSKNFQKILDNISNTRIKEYLQCRTIRNNTKKIAALQKILSYKVTFKNLIYLDIAQSYLQINNYKLCKKNLDYAKEYRSNIAEVYLTIAWLYLKQVNWNKALYFAKKANIADNYLIAPYFFKAANYMIQSQYLSALEYFRIIKVLFPFYKFKPDEKIAFQSALWKELISLHRDNLYKNGIKAATEAIELFPKQPVFYTFRAKFLYSCNHIEQSIHDLEEALKLNPYSLSAVIFARRILLEKNQFKKAFSIWERLVPQEILYDSENLIQNRYIKLKNAFKKANRDSQKSLIELANALIQVGWEKEALIVYKKISGMKNEKKKLKLHLEFMENFKELIYSCYKNKDTNIVGLITQINKLAKKSNIPLRVRPSKILSSYFILVREADPFNQKNNSLGRYLEFYNKILDIGNNYGYMEVRLMNRLSVKKYKRNIFGQKLKYNVIIGDETQIDNYIGYSSGSSKVAGRAFFSRKGFYISLDSVRPSFVTVKNTYAQIFSMKTKGLNTSLLKRSFEKVFFPDGPKKWEVMYKEIIKRSMNMVHNHELGHVFDFYCFLPLYKRLDNIFSMLWKQSFSPQQIQTRFERVADVFGLIHTKYPYYYLSRVMERLDTNFTGIFELVYWAWYGKLPQEDAYYLTSKQIKNKFKEISKSNKSMALYSKKELKKILLQIFNQIGTQKNCVDQ